MNSIKNNINAIFITITTFAVITLLVLAFNTNSSPAQNILPGVERMPDEPFGEYLAGRHALSTMIIGQQRIIMRKPYPLIRIM